VITVETRPERMTALQWHQPGDARELGEQSYRLADEVRYGLPTHEGMLRLRPGCWIVLEHGKPRVYSNGEFHHKFKVIEEEDRVQACP